MKSLAILEKRLIAEKGFQSLASLELQVPDEPTEVTEKEYNQDAIWWLSEDNNEGHVQSIGN